VRDSIRIALDAMGGDHAPQIIVEGADIARKKYRNASFQFYGDEKQISVILEKLPKLKAISTIHHTDDKIDNDTKPSVALRKGRNSSMRLAINAVYNGEADCIVSAGNTGALMAMAKFVLKVLPGVTRPAIASYYPTMRKNHGTVLLDLGANIECSGRNLAEFSVLGSVFAHEILDIETPKVGLLNVGEEEMKGNESVQDAAKILSKLSLPNYNYVGFVEGNDITNGSVDVVTTDGFTGNVTLKSSEGLAKMISYMIKDIFKSSPLSWLALPLLLPVIYKLKKRMDPRRYNGGVFMGLRGLCVKSHGGTDGLGFANAVGVAAEMVQRDFNSKLAKQLDQLTPALEAQSETTETDKA